MNSVIKKATVVCAALLAGVLTSRGDVDDYTRTNLTDLIKADWTRNATVYHWHEESPTHTGKAWAVKFLLSDPHFRFTTRLGRDNNTTAGNRLARLNEMAEKLKVEGRNPIVAINGSFFSYPQDKDKKTGEYLPVNLYSSLMSDSRTLIGLGGTLLTESSSHEFEFSTSRITSGGWPRDSKGQKIRNATGFYEPDENSLKIKYEKPEGGNGEYKNLDSDSTYPRSLIGIGKEPVSRKPILCFLVSDGRQPDWSAGVTDRDAVGMLVTLGCTTVAENDGGGSAGMWIGDLPVELQPRSGGVHSGFISRPDGGSPRTVAEGIFMTYEQPPFDSVHLRSGLFPKPGEEDNPYDTLEEAFRAIGANEYALIYNPITVKHSCTNTQPCTLTAARSAVEQTVTLADGVELVLQDATLENLKILAADGSGGTVKIPKDGKVTVGARVYDLRVESESDRGFCMGVDMTEAIVVDCRSVTAENQSFGQVASGISAEQLDAMLPLLRHPTDPQMIAVVYEKLGEKYLRWAKPTVRVGERDYESLDDALEAAKELDNPTIEIIAPATLTKSCVIPTNCTITATNENAFAAAVTCAPGATLTVGAGARVLFRNIVFTNAAQNVVIEVAPKGTAAVAGCAELGTVKLLKDRNDPSSDPARGVFELAGPLTGDVRVIRDPLEDEKLGNTIGFSSLPLEEARTSAGHVVNDADDELAGEAYEDSDGSVKIRWAVAAVTDENAVARFISEDDVTTNNYKSLRLLFRKLKDSGRVELLEDCPLVEPATIPSGKSVVLFSSGEDPAVVKLPASNGWKTNAVISVCGTLSVENVVFDGSGMPPGGSSLSVFRVYRNAFLELGAAAGIQNVTLASSVSSAKGVVYVVGGGTFQMRDGSFVTGCSGGSSGAAVYLSQSGAAARLTGGRIEGCVHPKGAVYAASGATVEVSGNLIVTGNRNGSGAVCNITPKSAGDLTLAGLLTGKVGVNLGNAPDAQFGVVTGGGDTADHFVCDAPPSGATLLGAESDGKLVWEKVVVVPPPNVKVGSTGTTYGTLEDAVAAAAAGDTLTILAPIAVSSMPVRIDKPLTITASNPTNVISRGTNGPIRVSSVARAIEVAALGVVFKNVVLGDDDCEWPRAFVHVLEGGELTLAEGAVIRKTRAKAMMREGRLEPVGRSAAGVLVAGTLVMEDGSAIVNCTNRFDQSAGGGVLASGPDAVFDFRGGTVSGCSAARGGGVFVEKHATALVQGGGTILGNTNGNLYVAAESPLEIADVFTGRIDYREGVTRPDTETNIFASVTYDYTGDLDALAAGAIRFTNELTRACGVAVTNAAGEASYVWNTALATGPTYAKNGVRWTAVGDVPPQPYPDPGPLPPGPEPDPRWEVVTNRPTPIAFKAIERVSETEWTLVVTDRVEYCNYRLIWTDDLTRGFTSTGDWEHAVGEAATPEWTTNVITTGGAWFWRAEGADGTNMVPASAEK